MSFLRRPVVRVLLVAVVLACVGWAVFLREDRPPLRTGDETMSSSDGEGLMDGREQARATVRPPSLRDPLVIRLTAPGSRVVGFRVIRLDDDADPIRIRQVSSAETSVHDSPARVSWSGYVARQPQRYTGDFRRLVGPWRTAPREGILVRPGEAVRLRTRYDLREPEDEGACWEVTLEGAPPWLVRKDGDDGKWKALRARDDEGDEHRDVRVLTGQEGPIELRSGTGDCRRGTNGLGLAFDPDGD